MAASDVVHGEDRKRAAVRTGARAGPTQPPPAILEFPMSHAIYISADNPPSRRDNV